MKPEDLIDEAVRLVNTDRQKTYDHPFDNFSRIGLIWSAILDKEITPEQVALCMVGVKLAREAYAPKDDNIIDGVGYFLTLAKVREARKTGKRFT